MPSFSKVAFLYLCLAHVPGFAGPGEEVSKTAVTVGIEVKAGTEANTAFDPKAPAEAPPQLPYQPQSQVCVDEMGAGGPAPEFRNCVPWDPCWSLGEDMCQVE